MPFVNDCLHLIWKTYHFSPKSKRELKIIGEELEARIYSPALVKGTRWVPHVDMAMRIFLQGKKHGHLTEDQSIIGINNFHKKKSLILPAPKILILPTSQISKKYMRILQTTTNMQNSWATPLMLRKFHLLD